MTTISSREREEARTQARIKALEKRLAELEKKVKRLTIQRTKEED